MTAIETPAAEQVANLNHACCCETCESQFVAAKRELSAFVQAVYRSFGRRESLRAAEYWLALVESPRTPLIDGYPNWRNVTIEAADRLGLEDCTGSRMKLIGGGDR